MIVQWLNDELRRDPGATPNSRACLESLSVILAMMPVKRPPQNKKFTPQEVDSFVGCGQVFLRSYGALSHQARARSLKLWPLRPKLHQLSHIFRGVQQTGVLPGWAFADEDYNQVVMRAFRGAPNVTSLGGRVMLASRYQLWRSVM